METLTDEEVDAFAEIYCDLKEAASLLERAGLSRGRMPLSSENSQKLWRDIQRDLSHGMLIDGRRRLLAAALYEYPGNATFQKGFADTGGGVGPRPQAGPGMSAPAVGTAAPHGDGTSGDGSTGVVGRETSPPPGDAPVEYSADGAPRSGEELAIPPDASPDADERPGRHLPGAQGTSADSGSEATSDEPQVEPESRRRHLPVRAVSRAMGAAGSLGVRLPRRRRSRFLAGALVLLLFAGAGVVIDVVVRHSSRSSHCGLRPLDHYYGSLTKMGSVCVGVSDNIADFHVDDTGALAENRLTDVGLLIWHQNLQVKDFSPVTLIFIGDLTEPPTGTKSVLRTSEREKLLGVAAAQLANNMKPDTPKISILFASGGPRMDDGRTLGKQIVHMMSGGKRPDIVGVVGPEWSRQPTVDMLGNLLGHSIPVVTPTLALDQLTKGSHPFYFQIAAPDRDEAAAMVTFAAQKLVPGRATRQAIVLSSEDPTDLYQENLSKDIEDAAQASGFEVVPRPKYHGDDAPAGGDLTNAHVAGESLCGGQNTGGPFTGVVFFAGRAADFLGLLGGIRQRCAKGHYPEIIADGDVPAALAGPKNRDSYPEIPFSYVSLAAVNRSLKDCTDLIPDPTRAADESGDSADFWKSYDTLCGKSATIDPVLDETALVFYDAVKVYAEAVHRLSPAPADRNNIAGEIGKMSFKGVSGCVGWAGSDTGAPAHKPVTILDERQFPLNSTTTGGKPQQGVDVKPNGGAADKSCEN
ncbi:effector-associated domain EAD1-containing protein [Frankia sp. Cj5]|uniref:effector-associated domain EAD1-containing protein n=1 Tax=Frankia sp. Cj5 TaxID=2880978 RepID=UPI001EF5D12E|nr:effector-associated domain EAD1-containing protein [Frankia sp. Cj5]